VIQHPRRKERNCSQAPHSGPGAKTGPVHCAAAPATACPLVAMILGRASTVPGVRSGHIPGKRRDHEECSEMNYMCPDPYQISWLSTQLKRRGGGYQPRAEVT